MAMRSKLFDFALAIDEQKARSFYRKDYFNSGSGMTNALEINLKNGTLIPIRIPDRIMERYVGGRALAIRLFAEYATGDDFAQNPLIITSAPMNNTLTPYSDSFSFAFQSPVTSRFSVFSEIGSFGKCLSTLGLAAVIIRGTGSSSQIINIDKNPGIRMEEIPSNLTTGEMDTRLRETKNQSIIVTGPAAENEAPFATAVLDGCHLGRGGFGLLLKKKNIRAIIVTPDEAKLQAPLKKLVSDKAPEKKKPKLKKLNQILSQSRYIGDREFNMMAKGQHAGFVPVCNFHYRTDPRLFYLLSRQDVNLDVYKTREITNPLLLHTTELNSYSQLAMLGANLGCFDIEKIKEWSNECLQLGLDPVSAGNVIGWAIDERKNGRLEEYPELNELSKKTVLRIINRLANPRGRKLYGLMARGAATLAGSEEYDDDHLFEICGLECGPFDYRGYRAMAIEDYYGTNLQCPCEPIMPLYKTSSRRLAKYIVWNNNLAEGLESAGFSQILMSPILCERENFWSFLSYFFPSAFLRCYNPTLLSRLFNETTGKQIRRTSFRDLGRACYLLETGINEVISSATPSFPPFFHIDPTSAATRPQVVPFVKLKACYDKERLRG